MSPSISVVVPLYNAAPWVGATLRSVADQPGVDAELIVVDDGSTDGGGDLVARDFPGARLVRTPNGGPSRARNLGTGLARGRFIQYLDADDLLAPGKLAAQLAALERSGADVAYGDWQRLEQGPGGAFAPTATVSRRLGADPALDLFGACWFPPAAYLFRREIVERIGGWHEGLPVIQDARFALDAALRGGRFVHTPGLMARYRVHRASSVSTRSRTALDRDIYRNAVEVEAWWAARGGPSAPWREALARAYEHAARCTAGLDPATFEAAYAALLRLEPAYRPGQPHSLALAARALGNRRALEWEARYRRARAALGRLLPRRAPAAPTTKL